MNGDFENIPRRYTNGMVYPDLYDQKLNIPYYYYNYPSLLPKINKKTNEIQKIPEFFSNSDDKTKNMFLMIGLIAIIVIIMMNYNKV